MPQPFLSSPLAAGSHLRVDGLSVSFAGHRVLTDVSFVVSDGDRVGLIGENGSGKSTLLRAIAGVITPAAGTVSLNGVARDDLVIGLLHQEPPFAPELSVEDALESAVAAAREAAAAVERLGEELSRHPGDREGANDFAVALETADRLGAWEVDSRIGSTLTGLGLGSIDRGRPTRELSGGQRSRVALAWVLLNAPDALLLDEPTNHLDDAATEYLVAALRTWRGPVLMASHDRAFLDEVATSLLDLDPSPLPAQIAEPLVQEGRGTGIGANRFGGTYSEYLVERAAARRRWERRYRDEQAELTRLSAMTKDRQTVGRGTERPRTEVRAARKFYADRNARVVSRRVNDARSRYEELATAQVRRPPAELAFRGLTSAGAPAAPATSGPVLSAVDATVTGRLEAVSLTVAHGDRWLITGPNGCGKSTLLSALAGLLPLDAGRIARAPHVRVAFLKQDVELPDPHGRGPERTACEAYADVVGADLAEEVALDSLGLIETRALKRPVAELSVGQRRRLALATLLAEPLEVLILDEPTNHFSLSLVTALEEALSSYPGTVVLASHDRWLRTRWSGRHFALPARHAERAR